MERRKKKKIFVLQGEDGRWYKEHKNITNVINNYFGKLFNSNNPNEQEIKNILEHNQVVLPKNSKIYLNKPLNREEIKKMIFNMGKLKAPRPDGFQAGFYQEY